MADLPIKKARPKYLNVAQIRLPVPGFVSIFHRISGIGLFIFLGGLIWLFDASLGTPDQLECLRATLAFSIIGVPVVKLVLLGLIWAFLHHFCAGIRFLLLDVHVGVELAPARISALVVFIVSLSLTVLLGVMTW